MPPRASAKGSFNAWIDRSQKTYKNAPHGRRPGPTRWTKKKWWSHGGFQVDLKGFCIYGMKRRCTKELTLPKTNSSPWKIHHFDGIYKETWGFSWAMLVSGRVKVFLLGGCLFFNAFFVWKLSKNKEQVAKKQAQILLLNIIDSIRKIMSPKPKVLGRVHLHSWLHFPAMEFLHQSVNVTAWWFNSLTYMLIKSIQILSMVVSGSPRRWDR